MSGAAQTLGNRSATVRSKDRTVAALRHLGLRGAALIYLGAMVLVPVAAIVTEGFGDGLTSFQTALAVPGRGPRSGLDRVLLGLDRDQRGDGHAARLGAGPVPVPGPPGALGGRRPPDGDPDAGDRPDAPHPLRPELADRPVLEGVGIQVAFTAIGILLALCVVTLPLVVRQVQPVLLELDPAEEEAAATLGAGAWLSFRKVVFPAIRPAVVGGALLTFARCIGEFGSVVLISGNLSGKTLTAPVFIFQLANQFRPAEAASVATLMFAISFVLVL